MITDIQKRTQNMLANRKEEVPKYTTHVEPKRLVPEDGDTSSQDNNFDVLATPLATPSEAAEAAKVSQYRNNFEMPGKPMNSTSPGGLNNKDARDTVGKAAEAAKDKGIIQLVVVAVVIAGTLGAYVWRNN